MPMIQPEEAKHIIEEEPVLSAKWAERPWNTATGVSLYRAVKRYRREQDPALAQQLTAWYAQQIADGLPEPSIPYTLPMLSMTLLWEDTHEPAYIPLIREWAEWLMNAPRGWGNILEQDEAVRSATVPLAITFLYRAGVSLEKETWRNEARYQLLAHQYLLQDHLTGLWRASADAYAPFTAWDNALIASTITDLLDVLTAGDPVRRLGAAMLEKQCETLRTLRDGDNWHDHLDDRATIVDQEASTVLRRLLA